ncbi:MAG: hypothetical protein ACRCXZ_07995 [Patescibacteria group bacterium]
MIAVYNPKNSTRTNQKKQKNKTNFIDWRYLKENISLPSSLLIQFNQTDSIEQIKERIVRDASEHGLVVICDFHYPDGLFEPVYFNEFEYSLGYSNRIKHFKITSRIDFIFRIESVGDNLRVSILNSNIVDEICSDPHNGIVRLMNLKI